MSQLLPFDQWVGTEGKDLSGLDQIQQYGDHYRLNSFADGKLNRRDAGEVDAQLFRLARSRGYVDPEDDELAAEQFRTRAVAEPSDDDLFRVLSDKFHNRAEGEDELRGFLVAKGVPGMDPELLQARAEAAAPFITPEAISQGRKEAVRRGEIPFAQYTDDEGKLRIEMGSDLGELSDADIANAVRRNPGIVRPENLPVVKDMLSTPDHLTIPKYKYNAQHEVGMVINGPNASEDIRFSQTRVNGAIARGDFEGARDAAASIASDPSLSRRYSEEEIINASLDSATRVADKDTASVLSTGEVVVPQKFWLREDEYASLVEATPASDAAKKNAIESRASLLKSAAGSFHQIAASGGGSDYTEFYENAKAAGKEDHQIVTEWFADDKNYSGMKERSKGLFLGTVEAFAGLTLYPMALAGNEEARDTMSQIAAAEQGLQQYAGQFGDEFGLGYQILRTAPAVAADIALSIPTGGAVGAASAATRFSARAAIKAMGIRTASAATKATTKEALRKGGVASALAMFGDDFTKKLGQFAYVNAATAPTAFNRSAGATYTSVYSSLEQQHPDWTPQQLREAAYGHSVVSGAVTVGIMSAFNGLAVAAPKYFGAGVEQWAAQGSKGLTIRQLNQAYTGLVQAGTKLDPAIAKYINLGSFNEFVESLSKQGVRNSLIAFGREGTSEAIEEGLDEFVSAFRDAAVLDEDMDVMTALKQAFNAAVIGGIMGTTGAAREVGVGKKRSTLSGVQQARFEEGAFSQLATELEEAGDVASAAFLRSQVESARATRTTTTQNLEAFGEFAAAQATGIEEKFAPLRRIPHSEAQRDRMVNLIDVKLGILEATEPALRTTKQRAEIAGLEVLREKYTELEPSDLSPVVRKAGPIKDPKGRTVATDTGTEPRTIDVEVADEADGNAKIAEIDKDIARLTARGERATPYQRQRIEQLRDTKSKIQALFAEPTEPAPEPAPTPTDVERVQEFQAQIEEHQRAIDNMGAGFRDQGSPPSAVKSAIKSRQAKIRSLRSKQASILTSRPAPFKPAGFEGMAPTPEEAAAGQLTFEEITDPETNEILRVLGADAATAMVNTASEAKRLRDANTQEAIKQGRRVSRADAESLATTDPDEQIAAETAGMEDSAEVVVPSIEEENTEMFPSVAAELRAQELALEAARQQEAKETSESGLSEEEIAAAVAIGEEALAAEVAAESTIDPEGALGQSDSLTEDVAATLASDPAQLAGATVTVDGQPVVVDEYLPATKEVRHSDPTGDAVVTSPLANVQVDSIPEGLVVVEDHAPNEPAADPPQEDPPAETTPAAMALAEKARGHYAAAKIRAAGSGKRVSQVLEEDIEATKEKVPVHTIATLFNVSLKRGEHLVYRNTLRKVKYNPRTEELYGGRPGQEGQLRVVKKNDPKKRGIKGRPIETIGYGTALLEDSAGVPRFLTAKDARVFDRLVEEGLSIETVSLLTADNAVSSTSRWYTVPFLNTVRKYVRERYPVEEPEGADVVQKTDPDPDKLPITVRTEYKYIVSERTPQGRKDWTLGQLKAKQKELLEALDFTVKRRHHKRAKAKLEDRLAEITVMIQEAQFDREQVITFDPRGALYAKAQRRWDELTRQNAQGMRLGTSRKVSRNKKTINFRIPFRVTTNKDGGETHTPIFTNDPAIAATALSVGIQVRAPEKYRKAGGPLNPAIQLDADGWVVSAQDTLTGILVTKPGDLLTTVDETPYTPKELKSTKVQEYVDSLPPAGQGSTDARINLFHLLGNTPGNLAPEDIHLGRNEAPDNPYIDAAQRYMAGLTGGNRRQGRRPASGKVQTQETARHKRVTDEVMRVLPTLRGIRDAHESADAKLIPTLEAKVGEAHDALTEASTEAKEARKELGRLIKNRDSRARTRRQKFAAAEEAHAEAVQLAEAQPSEEAEDGVLTATRAVEEAGNEFRESERDTDEILEARVTLRDAEQAVVAADATWARLSGSLAIAEEAIKVAKESGGTAAELNEHIAALEARVDKSARTMQERIAEARAVDKDGAEAAASQGEYKADDVRRLEDLARALGVDEKQASDLVVLLYKRHLREFALAHHLLTTKGEPVKLLKRALHRDTLQYIKGVHTRNPDKVRRAASEVTNFLRNSEEIPENVRADVLTKFAQWSAAQPNQDSIKEGSLREFFTDNLTGNEAAEANKWLDKKYMESVSDDHALTNYAARLLGRIAPGVHPDTGEVPRTDWYNPNTKESRPPSLKTIIRDVTRRYAKKLAIQGGAPGISLEDTELGGTADRREATINDQAAGAAAPSLAEMAFGGSNFSRAITYITIKDQNAFNILTRASDELGVDTTYLRVLPRKEAVASIWKKTHDILVEDPTALDELTPETRVAFLRMVEAAIPPARGHEIELTQDESGNFVDAKLQDVVDNNVLQYGRWFNSLGAPDTIGTAFAEGNILPQHVYLAIQSMANSTALDARSRTIASAIARELRVQDMPSIRFETGPHMAVAPWVGSYASDTMVINLTQNTHRSPHEVVLRGVMLHLLTRPNSIGINDLTPAQRQGLESAVSAVGINYDIVTDPTRDEDSLPLQFAMTDPVAHSRLQRKHPTLIDKIVDAIGAVLNVTSDIMKGRIRNVLSPVDNDYISVAPLTTREPSTQSPDSRAPLDLVVPLLPAGVTAVETESKEGNRMAWVTTTAPGTIFIDGNVVQDTVSGLDPDAAERVARAMVNHELSHLASLQVLTHADRMEIYHAMSDAERDMMEAKVPVAAGEIEIAEEFIRLKVEKAAFGMDSDAFIADVRKYGAGVRGTIVRYVRKFLNTLKSLVEVRPDLKTLVHIERVTEALNTLQRGGLPLDPASTSDPVAQLNQLEDAFDNGSEHTFYAVPVLSTDPAVESRLDKVLRRNRLLRETRDISNDKAFAKNSLARTVDLFTKDVNRIRKGLEKKGISVAPALINDALGSQDSYLSEAQRDLVQNQRAANEAAGMDPEEVEAAAATQIESLQQTTIMQREHAQAAALTEIARVSPELSAVLESFRAEITRLSLEVGAVEGGDMKAVYDARANVHLIRKYTFFMSSAWRRAALYAKEGEKVPGYEGTNFHQLRNEALDAVVEWVNRTSGGVIDRKKAFSMLRGWLESLNSENAKNVKALDDVNLPKSLFKEKRDIPEAVRTLMGEQRSSIQNAIDTFVKLGTYMATHDMAGTMRDTLVKGGFAFVDTRHSPDGKELVELFPEKREETEYSALHGLMVRADEKDVIREEFKSILPSAGPDKDTFVRQMATAGTRFLGASLTLKTLFSLGFFTRNEGSNSLYFLPMQGLLFQGLGGFMGIAAHRAARLATAAAGLRDAQAGDKAYLIELDKLGIVDDDVHAGLIRDLFNTKSDSGEILADVKDWAEGKAPKPWIKKVIDRTRETKGAKIVKGVGYKATPEVLAKINAVIDGKAKIIMFEFEYDVLKKMREELGTSESDWELKKAAAAKVHAVMQGHSQVYRPVQQLTGSPLGLLIAPFARFKAEVVRIAINTPRLAYQEMKEGREKGSKVLLRRGIRRMTGMVAVNTVWSSILVSVFGAIFKLFDDDDEETNPFGFKPMEGEVGRTLRLALPRWQRNHTVFARRNNDGTVTTIDLTYYNPLSLLHDPIRVFQDRLTTDGFGDALAAFTDAVATDFVGEGIAPGALRQILTNSDDYNDEIYLGTDPVHTKVEKMLVHYFENALKPGLYSKPKQVLDAIKRKDKAVDGDRAYDAVNIIVGEILGVRPRDLVESEIMFRSARNTKNSIDRAGSLLRPFNSPGFKEPAELQEAYDEYVTAYTELWGQHRRNAQAWVELTGDPKAADHYLQAMLTAGQSKDRSRRVMKFGTVDRPVRSKAGRESMYRAGSSSRAEGGEARVQAYVDAVLRYPRYLRLDR